MQVAEEPVYENVAVSFTVAIFTPSSLQVAVLAAVFVLARAMDGSSVISYSIVIPFPRSTTSTLLDDVSALTAAAAFETIDKLKSRVSVVKKVISFFISYPLSVRGCASLIRCLHPVFQFSLLHILSYIHLTYSIKS